MKMLGLRGFVSCVDPKKGQVSIIGTYVAFIEP